MCGKKSSNSPPLTISPTISPTASPTISPAISPNIPPTVAQVDECNLNIMMTSTSLVVLLSILFGAFVAITSPTGQENITPTIIAVGFGISVISYLFGIYSEYDGDLSLFVNFSKFKRFIKL
ncbi:hypothetical protein C1645_733200 [Glomus cerebriforme]|uniref:Uncharacterized protein n=1 Tax=Glomus cerebriforme TaxID=658196 RepID=A0A397TNJ4_9GLOM|nr:hypothetical protein C1645_733200 [Glomus cerebriforme]